MSQPKNNNDRDNRINKTIDKITRQRVEHSRNLGREVNAEKIRRETVKEVVRKSRQIYKK